MRCVFLLLLLRMASAGADPHNSDAIAGTWEVDNRKDIVRIEIKRNGDSYGGSIVWIKQKLFPADDPRGMGGKPKADRNNPDLKLRSRPIEGVEVLGDLRYAGKGEWKGGWIYAPDRGRRARCKAKLTPSGALRVRGFIGYPIFGSSMDWRRVEAD